MKKVVMTQPFKCNLKPFDHFFPHKIDGEMYSKSEMTDSELISGIY